VNKPRLLLALAMTAAVSAGAASTASAASARPIHAPAASAAAPAAAAPGAELIRWGCSDAYFDGDSLLGPRELPNAGPVGLQLYGYRRTDSQRPAGFLAQFRGASGWIYPPSNGYIVGPDGKPVEQVATLAPGEDIDRYGSVYGSFLAPAGTPYAKRSLPPSSLDSTPSLPCNYHEYLVLKPFAVDEGPIAPWFDQPGGGLQFQLDAALIKGAPAQLNVLWLLNNGYLQEITPPVG
jgi:hypothetical protein